MAYDLGIEETKELVTCTHLLHCWNVIYIFSQSKRLEDNPFIFLYPMWLSHMVSTEDALRADKGAMRSGELSLALGRSSPSQQGAVDPGDLEMCMQLLISLDLVYRHELTGREMRKSNAFNIFPKEFFFRLICRLHQLTVPVA
eukprot:gene1852-51254_t